MSVDEHSVNLNLHCGRSAIRAFTNFFPPSPPVSLSPCLSTSVSATRAHSVSVHSPLARTPDPGAVRTLSALSIKWPCLDYGFHILPKAFGAPVPSKPTALLTAKAGANSCTHACQQRDRRSVCQRHRKLCPDRYEAPRHKRHFLPHKMQSIAQYPRHGDASLYTHACVRQAFA